MHVGLGIFLPLKSILSAQLQVYNVKCCVNGCRQLQTYTCMYNDKMDLPL